MIITYTQKEIEEIVLDYTVNLLSASPEEMNKCELHKGPYNYDPFTASVSFDERIIDAGKMPVDIAKKTVEIMREEIDEL